MLRFGVTVLCLLALACVVAGTAAATATVYDIGDNLGGNQSMAFAINSSGVVAGYATTTAGGLGSVAADGYTYTTTGGMVDLDPSTPGSQARGIFGSNVVGWVPQQSTEPLPGFPEAAMWNNGTLIRLGGTGGPNNFHSYANTINGHNVVGGRVDGGNDAAIWWDPINQPTTYTDLRPALVATFGASSTGQNVVSMNDNYALIQYQHSAFYATTCVYDLNAKALVTPAVPGLGGNNIFAGSASGAAGLQGGGTGMSSNFDAAGHGWVVGASNDSTSSNAIRAYAAQLNGGTWTMTRVGSLGDSTTTSRAFDVNSAGSVVGWSYLSGSSGAMHAFLYKGGAIQDLNTLYASLIPSGWYLEQATDINDGGWIVGRMNDGSNNFHGFLIKPDLMMGDANGDGTVNITDLSKVLTNYDKTGQWADGDFNGDGTVNISDLSNVLTNYDKTAGLSGVTAVPEPGMVALLAAGLIGSAAFAWRKRK
jgi:probable HAF family extracellular repeat protein